MSDQEQLQRFARDHERVRQEMQKRMSEIEADAFTMAAVAIQYGITSLIVMGFSQTRGGELNRFIAEKAPDSVKRNSHRP